MTKEKQVSLKLDIRTAAAIRQVLFDSQKGYTYNTDSIPPRILDIRSTIIDIDTQIEKLNK
jgi:hypothetical protein